VRINLTLTCGFMDTFSSFVDRRAPVPSGASCDTAAMRFAAEPDAAALIGYMGFQAIAAGLARAGTTDTEALVAAFRGLEYDSPIGRIRIRRGDHQATVGNWIGTTAIRNGQAVVADPVFLDGADYLPPEEEVALLRPPQARA